MNESVVTKASAIFVNTLKCLRYAVRMIVHQGGQSSGKTVNILLALATRASEENNIVITVTGMSFPQLKGGALRDFEMFVAPAFGDAIDKYNKSDHVYYFKSGSIIEFKVFENEMTARGAKRKILFVNEANSFDWLVFLQLHSRSEQTIIDYNPSIMFWAHEKFIGKPGVQTFYSDHRSNIFLSESKHREIEAYCLFKRGVDGKVIRKKDGDPEVLEGDYELWKVYARGMTGNVTGLIFPNWSIIDDSEFPNEDVTFSIDYGYTNDPTAIVKQVRVANNIYIKELAYETGLSASEIKRIVIENGYTEDTPFYSEHDPDMIRQLKNLEVFAMNARKGDGSIKAGIEMLKKHKIFYTASSKNITKERKLYIWEVDKTTGKSTNKPVDAHNHLMDAIRYGAYSRYLKNQ